MPALPLLPKAPPPTRPLQALPLAYSQTLPHFSFTLDGGQGLEAKSQRFPDVSMAPPLFGGMTGLVPRREQWCD